MQRFERSGQYFVVFLHFLLFDLKGSRHCHLVVTGHYLNDNPLKYATVTATKIVHSAALKF